ncbi:MAG: universal stress protein [Nitrososphaeria archaeon]
MMEPTYKVSFWFRKILVPIDGSENSLKALDLALDFNMRYGSEITVLHVCENCDQDKIRKLVEKRIKGKVNFILKLRRLNNETSVSNEILQEINEENYDAVIMGARGLTSNPDIITGSVTLAVITNAPVTVITVR